jgi:hypothetical protein
MTQFSRLDRLPPYVFARVNEIKMEARREAESILLILEWVTRIWLRRSILWIN